MYEDLSAEHLKKGDEDEDSEDSGAWSYSYPSYSRFTFTGKTKSRLGRSHSRLNQPMSSRDNSTRIQSSNTNSVLTDTNHCNSGLSSQAPKTPGMSWLQKDKLSSSNSFTPGLFRQPTAVHDSQSSCNDSGVDVSSQSNFLFSLKNDSVQNSSCKRNLAFNTPFKLGEIKEESSLKELNQQLHHNSFPKLKFTNENTDENKENAKVEQNSGQVAVKEPIAYDVLNNKIKQTSDSDSVLFPPATLNVNTLNTINTGSENLLNKPNKPLHADDRKTEDDSSDTPIDLSSGKCLTHENVFGRSFLSEKEPKSEQPKEVLIKDVVISNEKSSSDGLNSILPTFLAPMNKSKVNEIASTAFNDVSGTKATVACFPMVQNEIPKLTQQVRNGVSPWFSASIGNNGLKPLSSAGELRPTTNQGLIIQNNVIKESNATNLQQKNILISNKSQNENAAKNFDRLSAIVNLSNCGNNDNLNSVVSKTKSDPHYQPLNHLSESSGTKLTNNFKSNNEFISRNHIVEDKLKTLSVNCKTNEYKNAPLVTLNSALNEISCPDPPIDRQAKDSNTINFNSKPPIPSGVNLQGNTLPVNKSTHDPLLSYDNRPHGCSAKTTEFQETFNHRVAKASRLPSQDQYLLADGLQQGPEISQQKTFLAPQQSLDNRVSNDFPHVKPDAPQVISSRLNCPAVKKPQHFKMSAPRGGLLSRSNSELCVNGKVYTTLSMLGRGGSSEVYQVLDERSSKLMAVKCVDLSMVDKTIAEGYLNEIDLLSKLQGCSSVIRMFDYEYVQEYKMLYVVMEKGDTDLSQLIRDISKTKKISMSMIIYYWTEMLTAVRDIHEKGIIHSDLKPANFLLVSGRLKLIDFGIASSQGDMTSVFKEVTTGTWNYMSPEAIKNTSASAKGFKITYKSDVWSLGCILYNLLYGKTPFSHITSTWSKLQAIADPSHQVEFPEVGAPLVLAEALQSCLRRDPKMRPTVAELLALPYHASGDSRHLAPRLRSILPHEWWTKISHLFQETKTNEEDQKTAGDTS